MKSFDNAPDKSNYKVLHCVIMAVGAVIMITNTVVIDANDALRAYLLFSLL